MGHYLKYPWAELGTPGVILLGMIAYAIGKKVIASRTVDSREAYRKRGILLLLVALAVVVAVVVLWARLIKSSGTFLGLIGGGFAIALREPLLALAGRIAIVTGRAYNVGDRVQIDTVTGDVLEIGLVYTRLLEIGHWIGGDQATGRIVQFSNSKLFGATPVFNYTRDFSYIWDEIMLPLTYASNLEKAKQILLRTANDYTAEFLADAHAELERMRARYLVPSVELKPQIYMTVTSNWVEMRMRYLVEPRKRRLASNFIWERAFPLLNKQADISIASQTSDIAIHWQKGSEPSDPQNPR